MDGGNALHSDRRRENCTSSLFPFLYSNIYVSLSIYVAQGNRVSREDLIHSGTRSTRTALWQWVSSVLSLSAVLRSHRKEGPRTVDTRKRTSEDLGEGGGGGRRTAAGRCTQERGGERLSQQTQGRGTPSSVYRRQL